RAVRGGRRLDEQGDGQRGAAAAAVRPVAVRDAAPVRDGGGEHDLAVRAGAGARAGALRRGCPGTGAARGRRGREGSGRGTPPRALRGCGARDPTAPGREALSRRPAAAVDRDHRELTAPAGGDLFPMQLMFVYFIAEDAGSAQDIHHYTRAAEELG